MKGVYVLLAELGKDHRIRVGALGAFTFTKGLYCYVGSAQKAIEKRLERHHKRSPEKKLR